MYIYMRLTSDGLYPRLMAGVATPDGEADGIERVWRAVRDSAEPQGEAFNYM